jgi:anti-sigma regulatory factor (Ser/Thr protein kinase)
MELASATGFSSFEQQRTAGSAGGHGSLSISYPAVAESVPQARLAAGAFAAAAGASRQQIDNIRLLVSEAVTNAVQHAYAGVLRRNPAVHLSAVVAAGELWVFVADDGCGLHAQRERSRAGLGLGLVWMTAFSDELTLHTRASGGLEVRLRFRLASRFAGAREPSGARVAGFC